MKKQKQKQRYSFLLSLETNKNENKHTLLQKSPFQLIKAKMSSTDCPCCFEAITAETGQVVMACSHAFHFSCLTNWFLNQEVNKNPQNCPCCRREASDYEKLPELSDDEEEENDEEEDEEDDDEDDDEVEYTRQQLHDLLISRGGTLGVTDSIWSLLTPDQDESLNFDIEQLNYILVLQCGRAVTEEEFQAMVDAQNTSPEPQSLLEVSGLADIQVEMDESLKIRWTRQENGDWVRQVLNPEEQEPAAWGANSNAPPPDELVQQTMNAARKIQAVFRGHTVRQRINPARALLSLC